jgi:hypothetical protein
MAADYGDRLQSSWQRQLRVDGAKFCEVLVASESARSRAIRLG